MLDTFSLVLYCLLSLGLLVMACKDSIWAVGYYMLNFFAQPIYWTWGSVFPSSIRWSLIAGIVLVVSVLIHHGGIQFGRSRAVRNTSRLLLLYFVNCTLVFFALSYDWQSSWEVYIETAKFVLLYFLLLTSVQSDREFRWFVTFLLAGLLYWGIQGKFGQIQMIQGRLEYFGGPGCAQSNELASIVVTLLPIAGAMIYVTGENRRGTGLILWGIVLASGISGLNVLLLCNSRGGFLGLIGAILTIVVLSKGQIRRNIMKGLAYFSLALFVLLGNPKIIDRFLTTFQSEEEAQENVHSRIAYASRENRIDRWKAAIRMIRDSPFGSGGNSFKAGKGDSYMAELRLGTRRRSVHQGFLREATDWGIQGLVLHLAFMGVAALSAWRAAEYRRLEGDSSIAFLGLSILASMAGLLITCLFGDLLHLEWSYWITALAVLYGQIYGVGLIDATHSSYDLEFDTAISTADRPVNMR